MLCRLGRKRQELILSYFLVKKPDWQSVQAYCGLFSIMKFEACERQQNTHGTKVQTEDGNNRIVHTAEEVEVKIGGSQNKGKAKQMQV